MNSKNKNSKKLVSAGIVASIAASLCCITPILALIAGLGGLASTFSWLDPLRPYLIGFSILILGYAWYEKLKPRQEIDCDCGAEVNNSFLQTNKFLMVVTLFATVMMLFPYYSHFLFNDEIDKKNVSSYNLQNFELKISGMTCEGCETFIEQTVYELKGIDTVFSDWETGTATISFDSTQTDIKKIKKIIDGTSYKVENSKINYE